MSFISDPYYFRYPLLLRGYGCFFFFVISGTTDRGIKPGSNWNSWHMNLMLTDFTPNWALFLFSLFHILERWNLDQIESHDPGFSCWQILRPIGRFFSIFVISFDRGIKLGSNWNSWPMNLMLTDFTPNWVLFLVSLFHMIDVSKFGSKLMTYRIKCWQIFTPNGALFLFSLFHILERWNLDQIESHDPGFSCWQILRPIGRFFLFSLFHLIEG